MSGPRIPRWYTLAWFAVLPLVAVYLAWRGLRQREYLHHWSERFAGRGERVPEGSVVVWVHAVSVGETRAARPLMEQLAHQHPALRFVLTHMTPTGRAAGGEIARALGGRVLQRYLPYDLPFAVRRFLGQTRPVLGILMETELWPNLVQQAHASGVALALVNARLSARSLSKAMRYRKLMRAAAANLDLVAAQTEGDRARLAQLFDGPIAITGNCKFDLVPDAAQIAQGKRLRAALTARWRLDAVRNPVWLFASTREGEERLILDALARWRPRSGNREPVLLFVPRHPQRFDEVATLLAEDGCKVLRRDRWNDAFEDGESGNGESAASASVSPGLPVLLGDSMGEMPLYYAMADATLIGGSLLPLGGQNLIEACACGCPVVLGPYMFNFAQAASDARAAGAARAASGVDQAIETLASLDGAARVAMARAGIAFAREHAGATTRTRELLEGLINAAAGY
jgi:3-deoxy-D-manno-octulosonic-acid transferase